MNCIEVTHTGQKIEVVSKHRADIPEMVRGQHLWMVMAMFKVTPNRKRYDLDQESLLTIEGPGCFWCEEQWSTVMETRPCPGDASPELSPR